MYIILSVISILQGNVTALTVLENGDLASSFGLADKSIKIWNQLEGSLKSTISGHDGPIYALAAHPNGNLISGSKDKTI